MKKTLCLTIALLMTLFIVNAQNIGTNIGDIAPDIELENEDGEIISLKSLRGKVVLIDFWASWCGPCRMENPFKIKAYNKYKNQKFTIGENFTIYSISLDRNKDAWTNEIQTNNMNWYHVSDLRHWNSAPAIEYGIRGIPSNFLIDENGIIVARNIRGQNILNTLEIYLLKDPLIEFSNQFNLLKEKFELLEKSDEYSNNTNQINRLNKSILDIERIIQNLEK